MQKTKLKRKSSAKLLSRQIVTISSIIILLFIFTLIVLKNTNIIGKAIDDPECVPRWKCSEFLPEKCPKEGIRIRECVDLNNCGTLKSMPNLTQSCERKNIILAILAGILIIIIIEFIIYLLKKIFRKKEKIGESPKATEKQYKEDPNYPSELEQYYSSTQTRDIKQKKKRKNNKKEEDNYLEKFPEKYWPK